MPLLAVFLALFVSLTAYYVHALSRSGALAAALVGAIIFGLGGWPWAVLLLTFFISSSALTRAFQRRKRGLDEKYHKGGRRDAAQVLANGGLAALLAGLHFFLPNAGWLWLGFAAALAAVNADTWATELGVLNPQPPRLITDLHKQVEKGTSGGISRVGTAATLAGAAIIALPAALLDPSGMNWGLVIPILIAGLLGSLIDSWLGATLQAMYFCPTDRKETEKHPLHSCGTPTVYVRGWRWLNNDWVNFACSCSGVILAILINQLLVSH